MYASKIIDLSSLYRTIQIYLMQGKRKSKLYEEQRTQVCGSDVPVVALRFKEVHMLWLTCDVVSRIISIKQNLRDG